MLLPELHKKLIAAARSTPADERVPYAFEKRIMARLASHVAPDPWALWGRALTRAAVCCVLFMLAISAAAFSTSYFVPSASAESLSQDDVEQTLFAAVDNSNPEQEAW